MSLTFDKSALRRAVNFRIRESLVKIGSELVGDIRDSMISQHSAGVMRTRSEVRQGKRAGKVGKLYKIAGKLHRASPPGSPPAPFSHRLKDSIMFHTSYGDKSEMGPAALREDALNKPQGNIWTSQGVAIGSNVPYAAVLEHGNRRIKPRPYLWPALKRSKEMIKRNLNNDTPLTKFGAP